MVFPPVYRQVSVLDAWWHAALGKWMVQQRGLPNLLHFFADQCRRPLEQTALAMARRYSALCGVGGGRRGSWLPALCWASGSLQNAEPTLEAHGCCICWPQCVSEPINSNSPETPFLRCRCMPDCSGWACAKPHSQPARKTQIPQRLGQKDPQNEKTPAPENPRTPPTTEPPTQRKKTASPCSGCL
jgi:hypothetical protein